MHADADPDACVSLTLIVIESLPNEGLYVPQAPARGRGKGCDETLARNPLLLALALTVAGAARSLTRNEKWE